MDRELFRETEWSKIYGTSAAHLHWESKFLDPSFTVSFASIRERWAELDNIARLDFSVAFSAKACLSEEDMAIVEFLMDVADANVCSNIAGMVAMLKDKQKAALLLTTKIDSSPGPLSNYFQALGQLGEQITIPKMRETYRKYTRSYGKNETLDLRDYAYCCKALLDLEGLEEYRLSLVELTQSGDHKIAALANRLLKKG